MKRIGKYVPCFIVMIVFLVLIGIRLFSKLADTGIADLDEGWHAVNSYEMFMTNNITINTYGYKVDYFNSKPPLSLWLNMLSFKLLGVSLFSLKFPSALIGLLTCITVCGFFIIFELEKKDETFSPGYDGVLTAVFFAAGFLTLDRCYDFHMYRTGNLDSLYNYLLILGMLCIIKSRKNNKWLIPFGAFTGLAFLTKSFNVVPIVLVAICCIPFMAKEKRWTYILDSVIAAVIVVLPWGIKRFLFDGPAFFQCMLFTEAEAKIVGKTPYFLYLMRKTLIFRMLQASIVSYIVCKFISVRNLKGLIRSILSDLYNDAVIWIWMVVPVLFYSFAGTPNDWYIYSSYIVGALLAAILVSRIIHDLNLLNTKILKYPVIAVLSALFLFICLNDGLTVLKRYDLEGKGGGDNLAYMGDMMEIKKSYGDKYKGKHIYLQYYDPDNEEITGKFPVDFAAYSEIINDLEFKDDGIDAWLSDEDAIIVVDKNIWDEVSGILAGYVIIQDNGFLTFSHDRY